MQVKNEHGCVTDDYDPAIKVTSIVPVNLKIETEPTPPNIDIEDPLLSTSAATLKSDELSLKQEKIFSSDFCFVCGKTFDVLKELKIHIKTCSQHTLSNNSSDSVQKDERDLTVIVEATMINADIFKIVVTASSLVKEGIEPDGGIRCLEWCAKHRLIANSMDCQRCDVPMELKKLKSVDGFTWRCPRQTCRTFISVKIKSFFTQARLPLWKAIRMFYLWAMGTNLSTVSKELDISESCLVDWFKHTRKICSKYVQDWQMPIGGKNEYVEIDAILCHNGVRRDRPAKTRYFRTTVGGGRRSNEFF